MQRVRKKCKIAKGTVSQSAQLTKYSVAVDSIAKMSPIRRAKSHVGIDRLVLLVVFVRLAIPISFRDHFRSHYETVFFFIFFYNHNDTGGNSLHVRGLLLPPGGIIGR